MLRHRLDVPMRDPVATGDERAWPRGVTPAVNLLLMDAISDRRRIPAAHFRDIIELLPVAVSILKTQRDADANIADFSLEYMNPAAERIAGTDRSRLLGRGVKELVPTIEESGLFDDYCKVVTSGEILARGPFPFTGEISGTRVSGHFELQLARYDDGVLAVSLDVTERVRAQEELVTAEAGAIRRRDAERHAKQLTDSVLHWLAEASHALDANESARARNAMREGLKAGSRIVTELRSLPRN